MNRIVAAALEISLTTSRTSADLPSNSAPSAGGTGKGRVYTITVQCKDASGNTSTKTTTVKVNK